MNLPPPSQKDIDLRENMLKIEAQKKIQQALQMKHIDIAADLFKNTVDLKNGTVEDWNATAVVSMRAAAEFMIVAGLMQKKVQ